MNLLKIHNLKKIYNEKTVLNISSCLIKEGSITALIGPSGAGKSTLFSIINGIEKPDSGNVSFNDEEFSKSKSYSIETIRQMSFLFQKPFMFNTTVYKNISFGLNIRNIKGKEIEEKVEFIAEWTGIKNLLNQKALTLSGGEAGRAQFARAMITNPKLLLMDEPTANLDPTNVALIEEMVKKANKEFNTTVFLITHNMFQAKRLSNRTAMMLNGEIIEEKETEAFFTNPKEATTKDFISGNMIY